MANPTNQDLATMFVQDEKHLKKLLYSHELDAFFCYQEDKGYFKIFDHQTKEFNTYLLNFLEERLTKNITTSLIDNVKELIKMKVYRKIAHFEPEFLSLSDKLLKFSDFTLLPHDIDKISFTYLPFKSEQILKSEPMPLFQKFLDEVIVKDDGSVDKSLQDLLQEMFGYCLLPTTKAEKTFFLFGDGANGKSVLLNILRQVVGEQNCSSYSIGALTTDKWATSGLIGKTVNICSEEESDYIKSDKFKAIVSGEPITLEKKFGDPTTGRINATFIVATNEIPTFSGFNNGLLRRMIIIPLKKTIAEDKRDVDLTSKLLKELPQIVAWSVLGAQRLVQRNYRFILPEACLAKEEEFKEGLSSTIMFIKENFTIDENSFISNLDLYGSYKIWAKDRGVKTVKESRFTKDVGKYFEGKGFSKESVFGWEKGDRKSFRGRNLKQIHEEMPMSSAEAWSSKEDRYPKDTATYNEKIDF